MQNYKNIKYNNIFLNNNETKSIETILDKEIKSNVSEPWTKLNKTIKLIKINEFVETLINENNLSSEEVENLKKYMLNCLDKKKLLCVKDVNYDKSTGKIKSIPCLVFNKGLRKFTLKRSDKRVSTLKSLGPGKTRKKTSTTIKTKTNNIKNPTPNGNNNNNINNNNINKTKTKSTN